MHAQRERQLDVGAAARTRNERNVRRDRLAGGTARQALQHRRRVGQRGHQLVDPGNHDVNRRQRAGQPRVALVAHQHHRAGFGHQCIRAGDPSTGVDEPTTQMPCRCPHQHVWIRRQVFPGGLADQLGRALARDVQRRRDDVRRTLPSHLHQELAQVGFHDLDSVVFQRRIELNLLGRHRLALDYHLHVVVVQHLQHGRNGVRGVGWPMYDGPDRFRSRCELLHQLRHPVQRRSPPSAQVGLPALEVARPKGRVASLAQLRQRTTQRHRQRLGLQCFVQPLLERRNRVPGASGRHQRVIACGTGP